MHPYSGYHDCPCPDCFEVAIGGALNAAGEETDLPALCNLCEGAGCTGQGPCQREGCPGCGDTDCGGECPDPDPGMRWDPGN